MNRPVLDIRRRVCYDTVSFDDEGGLTPICATDPADTL